MAPVAVSLYRMDVMRTIQALLRIVIEVVRSSLVPLRTCFTAFRSIWGRTSSRGDPMISAEGRPRSSSTILLTTMMLQEVLTRMMPLAEVSRMASNWAEESLSFSMAAAVCRASWKASRMDSSVEL